MTPENPKHQTLRRWPLWLAALLIATAALAYPGLSAPPLLDDEDSLAYVRSMEGWKETIGPDSFGLFRPFKNMVFYAFRDTATDSLGLWHSFVLGCFLAATAMIFFLTRKILRSDHWAIVASAIWALTPTQASVAIWMSCFNISLSIAFSAAFLCLHLSSTCRKRLSPTLIVLGGVLLFLAQTSYETAVAGAALAFLCDQFAKARPTWKRRIIHYGFYALVTLAFLIIRQSFGASLEYRNGNPGISPDIEAWQLAASAPWFLMKHFVMWLFPLGRTEILGSYIWGESATPTDLALAWVFVLALLAGGWLLRKRSPWISFGIFWFFLSALPSSNIIPIFVGPIEDYYLAFPSIGLSIALAGIGRDIIVGLQARQSLRSQNKRVIAVATLGILTIWRGFYIPFFSLQAGLWNRPLELFIQSASTRPAQYLNVALAARELYILGRDEEALALADEAATMGDNFPIVPMVRGYANARQGNPQQALLHFNELCQLLGPENRIRQACQVEIAKIHTTHTKNWELAREALLPVLENDQSDSRLPAIKVMSELYLAQGDRNKAIETLDKGLNIYPGEKTLELRRKELAIQE